MNRHQRENLAKLIKTNTSFVVRLLTLNPDCAEQQREIGDALREVNAARKRFIEEDDLLLPTEVLTPDEEQLDMLAAEAPEVDDDMVKAFNTDDWDEESGFNDFWAMYPRKVNKVTARRAWKRLSKTQRRAAMDDIVAAQRFREVQQLQFVPHAATYLNQHRWEDPIETSEHPGDDMDDVF